MQPGKHRLRVKPLVLILAAILVFTVALVGVVGVFASSSSDDDDTFPAKLAAKHQLETARAYARDNATAYPVTPFPNLTVAFEWNLAHQPTPEPTSTVSLGIRGGAAIYPGSYVVMLNSWAGWMNNNFVVVYAGRYTEHPEQGLVVVQVSKSEYGLGGKLQEYPTPLKEGIVTITAENNFVFTLKTEKGSNLTFDLAARAFK